MSVWVCVGGWVGVCVWGGHVGGCVCGCVCAEYGWVGGGGSVCMYVNDNSA